MRNIFLATLTFLMMLGLTGCSEKEDPELKRGNSEDQNTNIYIDSVPSGAEVYLLREKGSEVKDKLLGKTPLVLKPSECPGKTFWVKMNMGEYLEKVAVIPEMEEWITNFKSDRHFGEPGMGSQRYFSFETAVSRVVSTQSGGLVAAGPVYKLEGSDQNRICVLFIPKNKRPSIFYPLMPPPGTFARPTGRWPEVLRDEYRFSEEQAKEATECLTRCGKYRALVKDPFKKDTVRRYIITVQGPESDRILTQIAEINIIPGYNDSLFGH